MNEEKLRLEQELRLKYEQEQKAMVDAVHKQMEEKQRAAEELQAKLREQEKLAQQTTGDDDEHKEAMKR